MNSLYYGDNLDVLRKHIRSETVDLCYIDPPFNSKRAYNQIYNRVGQEDRAQAQAFIDTWIWDSHADRCYNEILSNENGVQTQQSIELIRGLERVLGRDSLFAYLVNMTARVAEIRRVLKPTGSFYLHCDPTASHYLKLVCDAVFVGQGGDYKNEISWKRSSAHSDTKQGMRRYGKIRDVIFFYTKSAEYKWNTLYTPYTVEYLESEYRHKDADGDYYKETDLTAAKPGGDTEYEWHVKRRAEKGERWEADLENEYRNPQPGYFYKSVSPYEGRYWAYSKANLVQFARAGKLIHRKTGMPRLVQYAKEMPGIALQDLWDDIPPASGKEDQGYPTQKPEGLLERIIKVGSDEGDVVLDAYCGCGTTVIAAQRLARQWIGIDITYQSISLILKRLEDIFGRDVARAVDLNGIPRDMEAAVALAHKKDDRLRKEFEKWAVLIYSNNRAIISDKKGADRGIDGVAFFLVGKNENAKIIFQVKSGHIKRGDIATLRGDMGREQAVMAVFITLEEPTGPMLQEAKAAGTFHHEQMARNYDVIHIVTVKDIVENGARLDIPMSLEVLRTAQREAQGNQLSLGLEDS